MFKIDWIESKAPDWKVASLTDEQGNKLLEVSINKVSKKGELFPNFDGLMPGGTTDGTLWTSSAGKKYLFPPKDATSTPRRGGNNFAKAQERKAADIEKAQAAKEDNIRLSSTFRDATLLTVAYLQSLGRPFTTGELHNAWQEHRSWLLKKWEPVEAVDDHGGSYQGEDFPSEPF